MEEKVLVKSQQYNAKKGILSVVLVLTVIMALIFGSDLLDRYNYECRFYERNFVEECNPNSFEKFDHSHWCPARDGWTCVLLEHPTASSYAWNDLLDSYYLGFETQIALICYASCLLIALLVFLWLRSYELTVTDKRIFGRVAWGKRVDLPQDSVTAISTVSVLKGITASTPSGAIKFLLIKNADEIYQTMNDLLIERQNRATSTNSMAQNQNMPTSNADELKKYKELLDQGIITQEEFDTKKKQLLGL